MPNPPRLRTLLVTALLSLGSTCAPPATTVTPAGGDTEAITESREQLGEPMLTLAESVLALSDGLDQARHKIPRGEPMLDALAELRGRQRAVTDAAQAAAEAAEGVAVPAAGAIVRQAATEAERAADAARPEIVYLERVGAVDVALLDAAQTWDQPGSQTEIRVRLEALAEDVARLRPAVRGLRPHPRACAQMKRNRGEWVATVRTRTLELQAQANSAGGSTFDRLRRAYRPLPFAVEPRSADRKDRQCWLNESAVARGANELRRAVDELRAALAG